MKIGELVLAWLFSVLIGSIICGFFTGEIAISIVFIIISGLFSLPYLILMILFSKRRLAFLGHQAIHFSLAFATGFVIVLLESNAFKFFYVLILYFVLGVAAQAYFYFKKPLDSQPNNEDILDI
jgi:hypothetical protein